MPVLITAVLLAAALQSGPDLGSESPPSLNGVPPEVTVVRHIEHNQTAISLFRPRATDPQDAETLVRRTTRIGGEIETVYADSASCPAVRDAYRALARIELPRLAFDDRRRPNQNPAGLSYSLVTHAARSRNGSPSFLEIRSTGPSPLAAWFERTAERLQTCWRSQPD